MDLEAVFKKRTTDYYKNIGKYLKYVLNDHFVLALLLLGGALGFTYSNYIQTVAEGAVIPRLVTLFLLLIIFSFGKIRTLIKPADRLFLLPKEKQINKIMKKQFIYSLLFHLFIVALIGFISLPLLDVIGVVEGVEGIIWIISLVTWKTIHLLLTYLFLRRQMNKNEQTYKIVYTIVSVAGLAISLFLSVNFGFVFSLIALTTAYSFVYNRNKRERWDFEKLIETEQKRVQVIYRLINLFIETPYSKNKVKRFKGLDFLFLFKWTKTSPHLYYLTRIFVRNTTFSGLYFRLVIIGGLFIAFTESIGIKLIISVLFLYLIGFQLLPLYQIVQNSIQFRLYPFSIKDKINAVQKLVGNLLYLPTLLFALISIGGGWEVALLLLVINLLFTLLFIQFYIPKRLYRSK